MRLHLLRGQKQLNTKLGKVIASALVLWLGFLNNVRVVRVLEAIWSKDDRPGERTGADARDDPPVDA